MIATAICWSYHAARASVRLLESSADANLLSHLSHDLSRQVVVIQCIAEACGIRVTEVQLSQ